MREIMVGGERTNAVWLTGRLTSRLAACCIAISGLVATLWTAAPAEAARRHHEKSHHAKSHAKSYGKSQHAQARRTRSHGRSYATHRKVYGSHQHAVASLNGNAERGPYIAMSYGDGTVSQPRGPRSAQSGRRSRGIQVASLGGDEGAYVAPRGSLSGGGPVRWAASPGCLNGTLAGIVSEVSSMSSVTVNSTCRSHSRNRSVGGAHRSHHLTGNAVDFRVRGNVAQVATYLRSNPSVGGFKHYGGGLFHIDTGPRRTW